MHLDHETAAANAPDPRYRRSFAFVTVALVLTWLAGLGSTLKTAMVNQYFGQGFLRTVVFDLELAIANFLGPCVVATALLAGVASFASRRGRGFFALRVVLAVSPAAAYFLRQGYLTNRFRFSGYWLGRFRDIGGISVPEALFHTDVWLANALIVVIALSIGGIVWLVLGAIGEARAARAWRAAARPSSVAFVAALVAVPFVAAWSLRPTLAERPSFIFVSLDTLRADHLGAYGYERNTSPVLDRLTEESVLFEWAISQAPNTSHSHMSIFTSFYPTTHGFRGERDQLAGFMNTLPEHLREAGYHTAATTDGGLMRGWYGYEQGFERYEDDRLKGLEKSVALAFDWLDGGLADSPFFLFVHTYDIHTPYVPPERYRGLFTDPGYSGGVYPGSQELEAIRRKVDADPAAGHGLTDEDVEFLKARYDEGIRYTDDVMGTFIEGLRSRGILDDAWLIIASDHGEEFTEHGSVLHEKLYHSVLHVPLIIRPPGGLQQGQKVDAIVELIDIMPTVLDLAGIDVPKQVQGASLAGLLRGDSEGWKNVAYSEHPWFGMRRSVTDPRFHFLTSLEHGEAEMYEYKQDRSEQKLLDEEALREVQEHMRKRVLSWSEDQIATQTPDGTVPLELDQKALDELKALGYIQ